MPKVWIELPEAETVEEAQEHCDLANQMLHRLGCEGEFFWATSEQKHCRTFYDMHEGGHASGGYKELADRGEWFNLKFLATGEP